MPSVVIFVHQLSEQPFGVPSRFTSRTTYTPENQPQEAPLVDVWFKCSELQFKRDYFLGFVLPPVVSEYFLSMPWAL